MMRGDPTVAMRHLSPTALQENGSRWFSVLPPLHMVRSLCLKPQLGIAEAGALFSPSDTVFNFCLSTCRCGEH